MKKGMLWCSGSKKGVPPSCFGKQKVGRDLGLRKRIPWVRITED
jgi:hypothetical protein